MCVCVPVCGPQVDIGHLITLNLLQQGFPIPGLISSAILTVQSAPGTSYISLPRPRISGGPYVLSFDVGAEGPTLVLILMWQVLYPVSLLPKPSVHIQQR